MKRIIAAIVFLVIAIGGGISSHFLVQHYVKDTAELMEKDRKIVVAEGKPDEKRAKEINDLWEKKQTLLAIMLPHEELEEIEIGIMSLSDFNSQGLTEEYVKTLNDCINRLHHIEETETPSLKNIF